MWVMLNDAMFSIVEDRNDREMMVVRSRMKDAIKLVFGYEEIENDDSDYRFRAFIPREEVKKVLADEVDRIDYENFKNSVVDKELHGLYSKVWHIFFDWQEKKFGMSSWWNKYLGQRYGSENIVKKEYPAEDDGIEYDSAGLFEFEDDEKYNGRL